MGILKKTKEQMMRHQHEAKLVMLARQILFLFIAFAIVTSSAQAADISREQKIKAAYIYNLVKLVEWPNLNSDILNVCILENSSMLAAANSVQGKTVAGRKLEVREVKNSEVKQNCNILYFSTPQQVEILQNIEGLPILTMGDIGGFANKGGIIHLFVDSNKIRFEINEKVATVNGLIIDSKLLELASNVIR